MNNQIYDTKHNFHMQHDIHQTHIQVNMNVFPKFGFFGSFTSMGNKSIDKLFICLNFMEALYANPQQLLECVLTKCDEIHPLSSLKLKVLWDLKLVAFEFQPGNNE